MDRQRERQTADAMMASAIAVAGREFYWDRFGGQVPPMVCAIGGTTPTYVGTGSKESWGDFKNWGSGFPYMFQ